MIPENGLSPTQNASMNDSRFTIADFTTAERKEREVLIKGKGKETLKE